jgi:hypothetical protein
MAPPLAGGDTAASKLIPYVVIVIGLFQLWYSWTMEKKGVLR